MSICDPQPVGPSLPMQIDGMEVYDTPHLEVFETCEVEDLRVEEAFLVLDFVCPQGSHSVSVTAPALPTLGPGDTVELSLYVDSPWWGNAYVKVMHDGDLVLAAMSGESLPNGGQYLPPEDFFAPLTHELLMEVCALEPEAEDDETSFIGEPIPCFRERRLAIAFGIGAASTTVFDHNGGSAGGLSIDVGRAIEREDVSCPDTPGGWREFIVVRPQPVAKR